MKSALIVALSAAALASAHGGVLSYEFAGTTFEGFVAYNTPTGQSTIQRQWATYNPITDATDPNIGCNDPGTITDPQLTANVSAGSSVTAYWNNPWPHDIGPMMVYMANCEGDCSNADPASVNWFKIDESGLINGTVADGFWGSGQMIAQGSSWTSTIPAATPDGNYLIRHETLAIHTANQPQFYMECAQITISGGGSGSPSPTILLPGGYDPNDPNIDIDVYSSTATTYTVPGPAVWSG